MTNKTYIKNTVLLFMAMAVTKIVGAIFKIPLANILGGTGMGYFSTAYGLYSPIFAVTAAGIPTVLMRLTAQNIAAKRYNNAVKIKHVAILLFSAIGAVGMCLIWLLSSLFANHIACSPKSLPAILFIAPAVLFCCMASVYRGYYEGSFNVIPTALANVTEAVSRAIIGLVASYGILLYARYCFENGSSFLGTNYNTYSDCYETALPIAAAGAIMAVTLSEVCGLIALIIHDRLKGKKTIPDDNNSSTDSTKQILKQLILGIIPIAVFALVMNCFSFIDLITVTRTLGDSLNEHADYYSREFADIFMSGVSHEQFANFAYGSYTGIAISLFMLIPSFAGMSEKTSLPEISAAWEKGNDVLLCNNTATLFKATALIASPACFGAAAMARPILTMLYPSRTAEVDICTDCFVILAVGGIFMVLASSISGFFQAIGRADIPLWLMSFAVGIKAIINPILISIPQINISGAALSTVFSYFIVTVTGLIIMRKKISIGRCLLPVLRIAMCGICCAISAKSVSVLLADYLEQPILTIISIFLGGVVYGLSLILTGVFRTSPIIQSEKQKKYRKGLEKSSKIG